MDYLHYNDRYVSKTQNSNTEQMIVPTDGTVS